MSIISSRLNGYNNICGIELDFDSEILPASSLFQKRYYDSVLTGASREGVYFGRRTVSFDESSKETRAGDLWSQTVALRFPNHDYNAIDRINEFKKAKFIVIKDSEGRKMVVGRNDIDQNRAPEITFRRSQQLTEVVFKTLSAQPVGFIDKRFRSNVPSGIPLILFS